MLGIDPQKKYGFGFVSEMIHWKIHVDQLTPFWYDAVESMIFHSWDP